MFEVKVRVNDILYDMKAVQYELSSFLVIAYVGQGGIESAEEFFNPFRDVISSAPPRFHISLPDANETDFV